MPYNGSGSFSLAQSAFVPNTPISSSAMNSDLSDIATNGLTNAVAKDGQTTITGAFKGAAGSVAAPMYSFSADLDCGMYRIGANNIGLAVAGANVLDIATTGLTVTGGLTVSGAVSFIPAGVIWEYGGTTAPTGFLMCNGASVLRATYPDLFTAIGTTFGAADGTHFNLPDRGGRVAAGKETAASRLTTAGCGIDGATLGAAGGLQNHTLLQAELPNVTLATAIAVGQGSHNHNLVNAGSIISATVASGQAASGANYGTTTIAAATLPAMTGTTPTGGSDTAFNVVQPTIIMNFIIKT